MNLPGVSGGAAAVRRTASGTPLLVGYIASADPNFDLSAARAALAESLPAALVPRLVLVDELPTRTSGKVDRNALPWPARRCRVATNPISAAPWAGWPGCGAMCSAPRWTAPRRTSSPSVAVRCRRRSWWRRCAARYPQLTVAQLYDHPRLGSLAGYLDELDPPIKVEPRIVTPTPVSTQAAQVRCRCRWRR